MCVFVCVGQLYKYLFITPSAFLDSYGSYFPWYAQSKASVTLRQTNKLNPSHNRLYTVFSCVKLSCLKLSEEEFAGKWREKQQGKREEKGSVWLGLSGMKNEG